MTIRACPTPVAFVFFNRPDETRRVFDAIRRARPATLFLIADGPRSDADLARCLAARDVVAEIDWPCRVHRQYAQSNLGCGRRVASGLDWVFSHVPEAIVIEDDCLPHPAFFAYCTELLDRYRHDERVFAVTGFCPPVAELETYRPGYFFSRFFGMWGWATWRRSWQRYDFSMRQWPELRGTGWIERAVGDVPLARQYARDFDNVYHHNGTPGVVDTWDFQFAFAQLLAGGFDIKPKTNLIVNLGVGSPDATHTTLDDPLSRVAFASPDLPLAHPDGVSWTDHVDLAVMRRFYAKSAVAFEVKRQIKRLPVVADALKHLYFGAYRLRRLLRGWA